MDFVLFDQFDAPELALVGQIAIERAHLTSHQSKRIHGSGF